MSKVALIKGNDRKDNIRKALELIADEIQINGRHPVIKVNFVSAHVPLSATHRDAVWAIAEFLKEPIEVFINSSHSESYVWETALSKLLSDLLKRISDNNYEFIINNPIVNILWRCFLPY